MVQELTKSLNRLPDETLCQAAMRFYSRAFITSVMPGMFDEQIVLRHSGLAREETTALHATKRFAKMRVPTGFHISIAGWMNDGTLNESQAQSSDHCSFAAVYSVFGFALGLCA